MQYDAAAYPAVDIVEAMIDGLRLSDRKLLKLCREGLVSCGGRVREPIQEAARRTGISDLHRKRLCNVHSQIAESAPASGAGVVEALLDGLRVEDAFLNEKASRALCHLQPDIVDWLILLGANPKRKPRHRIRLLLTAGRTRHEPSLESRYTLFQLAGDTSLAIRATASLLIDVFRQRGEWPAREENLCPHLCGMQQCCWNQDRCEPAQSIGD